MTRALIAFKEAKGRADLEESASESRKAVRAAPWHPPAIYNLAIVQERLEDYDAAIANLRLYLLAAPQAANRDEVRARIYAVEYKKERAARRQQGASVNWPAPTEGAPPARELYSAAYANYARGNYDLALQQYEEFLRLYRDGELGDNTQYWIGECHYAKNLYRQAIEAWDVLARDFPRSDKLPDAHLKKGMALAKLGLRQEALAEYRIVLERYSASEAAKRARKEASRLE